MADTVWSVVALIPSKSSPGKHHEVRLGADGQRYCTCPAWAFSKAGSKGCKHLRLFA
jgi:predicted nucleic acid-binding Zn finger protein